MNANDVSAARRALHEACRRPHSTKRVSERGIRKEFALLLAAPTPGHPPRTGRTFRSGSSTSYSRARVERSSMDLTLFTVLGLFLGWLLWDLSLHLRRRRQTPPQRQTRPQWA